MPVREAGPHLGVHEGREDEEPGNQDEGGEAGTHDRWRERSDRRTAAAPALYSCVGMSMHESIRRSTAFALVTVFALMLGGEAAGAHPCPHHDGLPAPHHGDAAAPSGHAAEAGSHAAHRALASVDEAPADQGGAHGACSCVGVCQLAVGAAVPESSAPALSAPAASTESADPLVTAPLRDAARLLPFAHGPPAGF